MGSSVPQESLFDNERRSRSFSCCVELILGDLPVKLVAQVMFRLKFFEAFMNMSRSRFG